MRICIFLQYDKLCEKNQRTGSQEKKINLNALKTAKEPRQMYLFSENGFLISAFSHSVNLIAFITASVIFSRKNAV